jgi:hypothetical protein
MLGWGGNGTAAGWTGQCAAEQTIGDFADLVCADDELLRAAFDAIVAAEWPAPPGVPRQRGQAGRPDRRWQPSPSRSGTRRLTIRSWRTGTNPRQRSPP